MSHDGSVSGGEAKVVEGYLYVYPYAGDDVFIHPDRVDTRDYGELSRLHGEVHQKHRGLSVLHVLEGMEGKRVRVVVEPRRVTIELLD
jgi:hypothetical protein